MIHRSSQIGQTSTPMSPKSLLSLNRLDEIGWDFASADTRSMTHNIHPYPAKFIPQIPRALISELSSAGDTVGDIFCGSGTTLLEALRLERHAVGVDANPLATLISRVKTTPLDDDHIAIVADHRDKVQRLLPRAQTRRTLFHDGTPFRSQGWRPTASVSEFWFDPHVVEELAELRLLIRQMSNKKARRFCKIAFSAIIVRVSKQDSDTRYVRREKGTVPGDVVAAYLRQLSSAIDAVHELREAIAPHVECRVLDADILAQPDAGPLDLVVTSPPYPNAYSYHLYHRTRLLWLGYDPATFKAIEIGSHRKYSSKGPNRATPDTFRAEFQVIFRWLRDSLRHGRYACFVIGDSIIDGVITDNATLIAKAGIDNGFSEEKRLNRTIPAVRKALNPKIGRIHKEAIVIMRKR